MMWADGRFAVIDGNRNFHPVMRAVLRSLGYRRIEPFLEGSGALDHLRSSWCDLAFVDLALTDGSGLSCINTLRRSGLSNRHMPIVVLTSATSRRNIEDAMAAGADYVMAKPVSPKLLADRIRYLKERPLDYVALQDGYYGPDPARFRSRPKPVVSDALLSGRARLESVSTIAPVDTDKPMGGMPEPAVPARVVVPLPELIFLD